MLKVFLKKTKDIFLDIIYPKFCLSCQTEGEWLCEKCLFVWRPVAQFFCPACYQDNLTGATCKSCRGKTFLDGAIALSPYDDVLISEIIKKIKYGYIEDLFEIVEKVLKKQNLKENAENFLKECVLVPVPLHRRRFLERGFNQAEKMARVFGQELNCLVESKILKRIKYTPAQAKLNRAGRRENVKDAFVLTGNVSAKRIILVDDVFTTGSTLNECARVLKSGGAESVWSLTVAREK